MGKVNQDVKGVQCYDFGNAKTLEELMADGRRINLDVILPRKADSDYPESFEHYFYPPKNLRELNNMLDKVRGKLIEVLFPDGAADTIRCQGVTTRGTVCKGNSIRGSEFCKRHQGQTKKTNDDNINMFKRDIEF